MLAEFQETPELTLDPRMPNHQNVKPGQEFDR
jgi:hypothetical protein